MSSTDKDSERAPLLGGEKHQIMGKKGGATEGDENGGYGGVKQSRSGGVEVAGVAKELDSDSGSGTSVEIK